MFEKLKDAYVKARYSKHYRITAEELAWLGERVEELGSVVQTICLERIDVLERQRRGLGSAASRARFAGEALPPASRPCDAQAHGRRRV